MENVKKLLPMDLQFFAEDGAEDENDGNEGTQNVENGKEGKDEGEKMFTQSQVSAMMAKEKKEGKASAIKSLGFSSEKEAKDAIALLKALQDSQKSEEEKLDDVKAKSDDKLKEVESRALAAESKLVCLENGVDKDCLDDVLAIASAKIDDDNSLEDVIKAMKKDAKYASFFVTTNKNTGRTPGNNQEGGSSSDDYGKQLASRTSYTSASSEKQSSYFI